MKYLFDTHIILWALVGDSRLSKEVYNIVNNKNNEIYYSSASSWEIEIKHLKIKKFNLSAEQFIFLCEQSGLLNIPVNNKHIIELKNIKKDSDIKHNDTFDQILLAQAIAENMTFVTHDEKFNHYKNNNIMIV